MSSPELAYETLVGQSHAFKKSLGAHVCLRRPLLGNGLLASDTEDSTSTAARRMMAPAPFMHRRIADYATTIGGYASKWARRLKQRDTADLSSEMMHLTFEIVGKTLFDADLSAAMRGTSERRSPPRWRTSTTSRTPRYPCCRWSRPLLKLAYSAKARRAAFGRRRLPANPRNVARRRRTRAGTFSPCCSSPKTKTTAA